MNRLNTFQITYRTKSGTSTWETIAESEHDAEDRFRDETLLSCAINRIERICPIKTYRKSRNLTQAQAAELFRVSLRTYKNWELGAHDMPGPAQLALELLIKLKTN